MSSHPTVRRSAHLNRAAWRLLAEVVLLFDRGHDLDLLVDDIRCLIRQRNRVVEHELREKEMVN